MNIVRITRQLKRSLLLVSLLSSSLILSACGGSDNKSTTASSSSSSSSTHVFVPTPITLSGSGVWPDIKVTANGTKTLHFEWSTAPSATYYKLLKKIDATSSYEQVGNNITTPTSTDLFTASDAISVHLTDWVNSRYIVQACDNSSCVDSTAIVTNSAMLSAITYFKASNAEASDWFGWSFALSGDGQTLAVGAPAEDGSGVGVNQDDSKNDSTNSGAVYVFTRNTDGSWVQQAYLKASNTQQPNDNPYVVLPNDRFGYQVALSTDGNTLAISALLEDSPSNGIRTGTDCYQDDYEYTFSSASSTITAHKSTNVGAVYIFKRTTNVWAQTTYVKPHNPVFDGYFGGTLSISGDGKTLAVGTVAESTYAAGITDMRSVSSSSYACPNASLSSESSSSSSSSSKSSSSSSLVGGLNSGAVYLFKETDAGWIEESFIKASDAQSGDYFGTSISLSDDGSTLAVGAIGEDSKDSGSTNDTVTVNDVDITLNNGGVYIFANANDAWTQQAKVKPYNNGISQQFGYSVSLSGDGNTLAVGTPGDWTKILPEGTSGSRSIEDITANVIGPLGANYNLEADTSTYGTGAAYIFIKQAEAWTATTYIKASNAQTGYQFGNSVSLSQDGRTLAVGSIAEASQATGINGDPDDMAAKASGAAYIFKATSTSWEQKSYVKAPNTDANNRFGNSVKLDDSGDTLAVGAHRESSNATGINGDQTSNSGKKGEDASGAVYVY